jgi:hypothetical protein
VTSVVVLDCAVRRTFAFDGELAVHDFEAVHSVVNFDPAVDACASKCNNQLSRDVAI